MRHLFSRMLRCDWLIFSCCDWCISILAVSFYFPSAVRCHGSPVVVFLDCWYPCFWNFSSSIPVDVVRVKLTGAFRSLMFRSIFLRRSAVIWFSCCCVS